MLKCGPLRSGTFKPLLFIEYRNPKQKKSRLLQLLGKLQYECVLLRMPIFNEQNFRMHQEDIWSLGTIACRYSRERRCTPKVVVFSKVRPAIWRCCYFLHIFFNAFVLCTSFGFGAHVTGLVPQFIAGAARVRSSTSTCFAEALSESLSRRQSFFFCGTLGPDWWLNMFAPGGASFLKFLGHVSCRDRVSNLKDDKAISLIQLQISGCRFETAHRLELSPGIPPVGPCDSAFQHCRGDRCSRPLSFHRSCWWENWTKLLHRFAQHPGTGSLWSHWEGQSQIQEL